MVAPLKGPEASGLRFEMRVAPGLVRAVDDMRKPGESRADVHRRALRELYRQHLAAERANQASAARAVVDAAMHRTDQTGGNHP